MPVLKKKRITAENALSTTDADRLGFAMMHK
jgi:hypothetical protein